LLILLAEYWMLILIADACSEFHWSLVHRTVTVITDWLYSARAAMLILINLGPPAIPCSHHSQPLLFLVLFMLPPLN
jgi:hypothetical protein